MEGITILSQQIIYIFQKIGFLCLIIGIILGILMIIEDVPAIAFISSLIIIFGIYNIINPIPIRKHIQYKVTIGENVKMQEFYKHYKIINQEGQIYTIKKINKQG